MRIVTYNIQFGRGKDRRIDLERIASEVAEADLIAMQEVERFWPRSGYTDQPQALARLLGLEHWVYGAGVDLQVPGEERRRQFGNLLLARAPIVFARNHLLPKYGSLGPASIQRSALEGVVETSRGPLRFYSVHLTHLAAQTRLPQIDALLALHHSAPSQGPPIPAAPSGGDWDAGGLPEVMPREALLLGDFNFEPDSEEYVRLVGPESVYGGRVTNPEGFVDAWVEAGREVSAGATSDVDGRAARLDYCFVSAALRRSVVSARVDTAAQGSDHQPLWVEVDL